MLDFTCINFKSEANDTSKKYYENSPINIMNQFLSSNNHEDVPTVIEYDSVKRRVCHHKNFILGLLLLNQIVFNRRYQFFCSWQQ